jgi:hypothetical protein
VRVEEISTNVGLGVEPVLAAAPPNIVVRKPISRPQQTFPPQRTIPPLEIPEPVRADCPRAGDFDFPALDAGVDPNPRVRPAPGSYKYKLDGKIVTESGEVVVDEFETREITKVEDDTVTDNAFHFTVKQSDLLDERRGTGTIESVYRVVPTGNTQNVPNPPVGPGVSDIGRGVYLVSHIFRGTDDMGKPTVQRFEPSNPLLLLPFPVEDGTAITASGTDPQTGAQVTIDGQIKGKKQIDACGDRVDTWFVDATEKYRYSDPQTLQTQTIEADYDYGVAPQYGGLLLYERVVAPIDGPIITIDSRVGRVPKQTKVS